MNRGVTLIELILVLGIIFLLVAAGLFSFSSLRGTSNLNVAAEEGLSLLLDARSRTRSSFDASSYGVHFENSKIVFFKGDTYIAGQASNREYNLPVDVEISSVAIMGGGNEVIFKKLTGGTDFYGTTTLRLISATTTFRLLVILPNGVIKIE